MGSRTKEIFIPGDDTRYVYVSDETLRRLAADLAERIIKDNKRIDYMTPVAKGGWPVGRNLFDLLQPIGLKQIMNLGSKSMGGVNEFKEANIYQKLADEDEEKVRDKVILVVDDLSDTGGQFKLIKQYLEGLGVQEVILAALFRKPHSAAEFDYWVEETNHWIIFAYEAIETMRDLYLIWRGKDWKKNKIEEGFREIGFAEEDIEFFWKHLKGTLQNKKEKHIAARVQP